MQRSSMGSRGICVWAMMVCAVLAAGCASVSQRPYVCGTAAPEGDVVFRTAAAQDADAFAAGKAAAKALQAQLGDRPLHAVVMAECFEGEEAKEQVLEGVAAVFPRDLIFGFATYGCFTHAGCLDLDSVGLLGIGGDGVAVSADLVQRIGIGALTMEHDVDVIRERLFAAGIALAEVLPQDGAQQLAVVMADAHSPKNQFLVEGLQEILGPRFPITGGSANKNMGQTYVYYRGGMYQDAAVALMISGNFHVSMAGREAKSNDAVIASAKEAAAEAHGALEGAPAIRLAFNCAGRKGKLDRIEDELAALEAAAASDAPLFGCYCAGEIGPSNAAEANAGVLSSGVGWHLMYTVLGR